MTVLLYDHVLSPNCYKARLMARLAGVPLETVAVNAYPGREHLSEESLARNPAGTLPVLVDGDLILTETQAILVYLAQGSRWMGAAGPATAATVQGWLAFSARLTSSLGVARAHDMLRKPADIAAARSEGTLCLREIEARLVEQRLRGQGFLAGADPTIADVACFPHVALAPDGGVTLDPYPAIRLWMRAIRGLDGFIEMPGIHRRHDLTPEPQPAVTA